MPVQRCGALLVGSGGLQARQGHGVELSGANSRVSEDRKPALLHRRARRPIRRWGAARSTDHAVFLTSRSESWISPASTTFWRTWTSLASTRRTDKLDRIAESQGSSVAIGGKADSMCSL